MDLYATAITAATGRDTIPQADWDRVRVYLPRSQKHRIIKEQAFERTDAVKAKRIFPEELRERRKQLVMPFRISMASFQPECVSYWIVVSSCPVLGPGHEEVPAKPAAMALKDVQ